MDRTPRQFPSYTPIGPRLERDESARDGDGGPLPSPIAPSGALDRLVETARDYARHAASANTLKAYAAEWAQFALVPGRGANPLPPLPQLVGLYIADLAALQGRTPALLVASIERRLSGLGWLCATRAAARPPGPAHRLGAGRHPPQARPPA